MTTLREETAKLLWLIYIRNEYGIKEYKDEYRYEYGVHNWTKYTEQDKKGYLEEADEIIELFEKMIDEKQNIKNLKPASKPEDVIYNSGIFDGLQELKEELKK